MRDCESCKNHTDKGCTKWKCEFEPTTKNDLGVDCISRTEVLKLIYDYKENHSENREKYPINYGTLLDMIRWIRKLPSVTLEQEQSFEWCTECKEYDQEKHCCHRWSKAIRNTVEEMKQEPVLSKIREEIKSKIVKRPWLDFEDRERDRNDAFLEVLDIIDKYKAESEG